MAHDWNTTLHFAKEGCAEALARLPAKAVQMFVIEEVPNGPQPGEVFIPLSLEALKPQRFDKMQHIHRCAMINHDTSEAELQGRVMDYIIANETEVPAFLLNDVPIYLAGYKRGFKDCGE